MDKLKLGKLKEEYSKLDDKLYVYLAFTGQLEELNTMDMEQMNKWVKWLVDFYEAKGIKLTKDDFDIENNISNYQVTDKIVRSYMEVFFRNIHNLDSDEFGRLIFSMRSLSTSMDMDNPFREEILTSVRMLGNRQLEVTGMMLGEISDLALKLGYSEVTKDNIFEIRRQNRDKINEFDLQLENIRVHEALVAEKKAKKDEFNNKLSAFCMVLVGSDRYKKMSDNEKQMIIVNISKMVEVIVKLRIFEHVSKDYNEYSLLHSDTLDEIRKMRKEKDQLVERLSELKNKGGLFPKRRETLIADIDRNILGYSSTIKRLTHGYLGGFYEQYSEIGLLSAKYKIHGITDNEMLFGVFDIFDLPPTSEKVSQMECFKKCNIEIPLVHSSEFINLSNLAVGLTQGEKFLEIGDKETIYNNNLGAKR